jgi:branched-chain amino acid transport system ATP-binding protein
MEALEVRNVYKNFGGLKILSDLSFKVSQGERVALIGPNGAGKTTTLNLVSGELPVTDGQIFCFGRDITKMRAYERAHFGMAHTFQIIRLPLHLTVLNTVLLAAHGIRRSRFQMFRGARTYNDLMARAKKHLEMVELWDERDSVVQNLAYGQQRQLAIITSLVMEPRLLLLDEPSAGLDVADIPNFINMVKMLTEGTTTVFVAHDMEVVLDLADRVLVLYYGKIIAEGTPEEIQNDQRVKEIYLGVEDDTLTGTN